MRLSRSGYLIREGFRSITTHGFMSFATVAIIMACLIIIGSVSLLSVNIDAIIKGLEDQNEVVAFAMRVVGASNKEIKKRVPYVLELVGLEGREKRMPNELSGGEQQRVAIARALVNSPRMIVADEPTGNLDPVRSLELMLLFEKINEMGTTILVVTHEKELVNAFSKRVITIDNGHVISDGMDGYYSYEIE